MSRTSTAFHLLALLVLGVVSLAHSQEAAIDTARWGVYSDLIGTQKQAPGGYRLRWSWVQPGVEVLEEWIAPSSGKVSHTAHITLGTEPNQFRVKGTGGKWWSGTQQADGSIVYIGEGLLKMPYGVRLNADGTYLYLEVKLRGGKVDSVQPETAARMSFAKIGDGTAPAATMNVASTSQPVTTAVAASQAAHGVDEAAPQGVSPLNPASLQALAQTWGPLAHLANSAWTTGGDWVLLDHFQWSTDKTRIRAVLNSHDLEGLNWVINFRVGPKPNTLTGEVNFGEVKKDVLFRFEDSGILTSDWTRINDANCRFEIRYVGGVYHSRIAAEVGRKPAFHPLRGTYQRIPLEELDATYERNRVWLAKVEAERARLAEEQRQRELEALAAQQRAYQQRSYESAPVYDRNPERVYERESPRGPDGLYDRGDFSTSYQPDILGAFQRGLNEGLAQSDAREAQAMDGIREAVRQGNAIYEAEQERLRLEREAAFERERALAAEREYEAQLSAQREAAARQAREAQEAAAAEEARRVEQARIAAQVSTPPSASASQPVSSVSSSKPSDCYFVDAPGRVAMGFSRVSEADARSIATNNAKGCKLVSEMNCDSGRDPVLKGNGLALDENKNIIKGAFWWDCRVTYFCGEQRQVCPSGPAAGASRQ
jgi:hypothetical protein